MRLVAFRKRLYFIHIGRVKKWITQKLTKLQWVIRMIWLSSFAIWFAFLAKAAEKKDISWESKRKWKKSDSTKFRSIRWAISSATWEQVKLSLVLTLILIQSVSVISRTGNLIHTKVSNLMKKSADVEHLTRWAVLFLQYTVLRSWKTLVF